MKTDNKVPLFYKIPLFLLFTFCFSIITFPCTLICIFGLDYAFYELGVSADSFPILLNEIIVFFIFFSINYLFYFMSGVEKDFAEKYGSKWLNNRVVPDSPAIKTCEGFMKVKITINGQTFEKDVDDSGNVNINMGETSPKRDPHKEYIHYEKFNFPYADQIEREITYDDSGNIVEIKDRNLSREERLEHRRLNRIKRDLELKNTPLFIKVLSYLVTYLIVLGIPILFLIWMIFHH